MKQSVFDLNLPGTCGHFLQVTKGKMSMKTNIALRLPALRGRTPTPEDRGKSAPRDVAPFRDLFPILAQGASCVSLGTRPELLPALAKQFNLAVILFVECR